MPKTTKVARRLILGVTSNRVSFREERYQICQGKSTEHITMRQYWPAEPERRGCQIRIKSAYMGSPQIVLKGFPYMEIYVLDEDRRAGLRKLMRAIESAVMDMQAEADGIAKQWAKFKQLTKK